MKSLPLHHLIAAAVTCLISAALLFLPDPPNIGKGSFTVCRAKVLETDNQDVALHGLLKFGSQKLEIEILSGEHKGRKCRANNELRAQMELDKEFKPGDIITVNVPVGDFSDETVLNARDHHRSFWIWVLGGIFCLFLIAFGSWVGVKAILSFLFSFVVIWKAVIPATLAGWSPEAVIAGATAVLTFAIIFLVAGFNRKGVTAFCGAMAGVLSGLLMSSFFTTLMKINGAVMPYCQTLFYSGFDFLDLQRLFAGTLILGASGAVMDLAMDIASGADEIVLHNPQVTRRELIASALRMGRSVVGTMTTTLLLAYSGGYLTLLMMFSVQGTHIADILNNPLVAAETVKTLIGSFSLVLVAPLTAITSGWIFTRHTHTKG